MPCRKADTLVYTKTGTYNDVVFRRSPLSIHDPGRNVSAKWKASRRADTRNLKIVLMLRPLLPLGRFQRNL